MTVKRYKVTVTEIGEEEQIIGKRWEIGAGEDGKYGYTPETVATRGYERVVYEQTVTDLHLVGVVRAVNLSQEERDSNRPKAYYADIGKVMVKDGRQKISTGVYLQNAEEKPATRLTFGEFFENRNGHKPSERRPGEFKQDTLIRFLDTAAGFMNYIADRADPPEEY